jgi:hypothetical protein
MDICDNTSCDYYEQGWDNNCNQWYDLNHCPSHRLKLETKTLKEEAVSWMSIKSAMEDNIAEKQKIIDMLIAQATDREKMIKYLSDTLYSVLFYTGGE